MLDGHYKSLNQHLTLYLPMICHIARTMKLFHHQLLMLHYAILCYHSMLILHQYFAPLSSETIPHASHNDPVLCLANLVSILCLFVLASQAFKTIFNIQLHKHCQRSYTCLQLLLVLLFKYTHQYDLKFYQRNDLIYDCMIFMPFWLLIVNFTINL